MVYNGLYWCLVVPSVLPPSLAALQLLRLELVDAETVAMIHDKFIELDRDGSGYLTADELLPMKRIPSLMGLRANQSFSRKAAERRTMGHQRTPSHDPEAPSVVRVTSELAL